MSKPITRSIPLGALRELVTERTQLGERSISMPDLLRWLDLEEPLVSVILRISDARGALSRRDLVRVDNELVRMESQLQRLGFETRTGDSAPELDRLRAIEAVARRLVSNPLWYLRQPNYEDAAELETLVLGTSHEPPESPPND